MPRMTRLTVVGLLLLALASTAVQALPATPRPRAEAGDSLSAAWDWLVSILISRPEAPDRSSAPTKEGSQIDPNGSPH